MLGEAVANRFGELPFLFKVLCAAQPLSIQVHPNKRNSEIGFAKENAAGIPMDAAERNYKDPNHKPGWFCPDAFHGDERVPRIF